MGFFDSGSRKSTRTAGAAAAAAWMADVGAALPGAQVSVESWSGQNFGQYGSFHTYTVRLLGTRGEFPALVGRLAAPIDALGKGDRLQLQVAGPEGAAAVFSELVIAGENREREWVHFLVRSHDALLARIQGESLRIDGEHGQYTVMGASRTTAVATARELMSWWADLLAAEPERWPLTGLSLEIGGSHDDPEIDYTVDLTGPGQQGKGQAPLPVDEKRQLFQLAVSRWNAGLDDLEAAIKLPVRPGYGLELVFEAPELELLFMAVERSTGIGNEDLDAELAAEIRRHNPASIIQLAS